MEEQLAGGKTVGAVRIDGAVHRVNQPWTPAVHAVLGHLEAIGFAGAPRVLGFDEQGRERLTYLEGETVGTTLPWPAWVFSDDALVQVGRWLRGLHDATADFVPAPDLPWLSGRPWRPGLVIGHQDAGPYNAVWRDGRLVGFVDWDTTGPSSREVDLAFVALTWVPLHAKEFVAQLGFSAFEDRSRRLHLLLDAYGYEGDRSAFGTAVAARARINAHTIRQLAASGDPVYAGLLPMAESYEQAAVETEALPAEFWVS